MPVLLAQVTPKQCSQFSSSKFHALEIPRGLWPEVLAVAAVGSVAAVEDIAKVVDHLAQDPATEASHRLEKVQTTHRPVRTHSQPARPIAVVAEPEQGIVIVGTATYCLRTEIGVHDTP